MSAAGFGKQGITSILASDYERPKTASLRRTLSADMSSRKWIAQNSLYEEHRLDDIADSPADGPAEDEQEDGGEYSESKSQFNIWSSIQEEKNRTELEETRQSDIWSLILSQKTDQSVPAAPYVHPLTRRSAGSLSKKSLEICTESLGSETGSDGFSSYHSSDTSDGEEDKEEFTEEAERMVSSSSISIGRKRQLQQLTRSRSFPPPLPPLSDQNGASLRVRSHRNNGRLVLEAVSVKEQKNFRAQREGGRLVLTFINNPSDNDHHDDDGNDIADGEEADLEETGDSSSDDGAGDNKEEGEVQKKDVEAGEGMELAIEELPKLSSEEVSVNKLAILMDKPVVLADRRPVLFDRFGDVLISKDVDDEKIQVITSYNDTYKSAMIIDPTAEQSTVIKSYDNNNDSYIISEGVQTSNESQEFLVLRGNDADHLVPLVESCKDARRSLFFLGPRCIATT